jgi:hypothetical protein
MVSKLNETISNSGPLHSTKIGPFLLFLADSRIYHVYSFLFLKFFFGLSSLLFLFPLRSPLSALRSHRSVVHQGHIIRELRTWGLPTLKASREIKNWYFTLKFLP